MAPPSPLSKMMRSCKSVPHVSKIPTIYKVYCNPEHYTCYKIPTMYNCYKVCCSSVHYTCYKIPTMYNRYKVYCNPEHYTCYYCCKGINRIRKAVDLSCNN